VPSITSIEVSGLTTALSSYPTGSFTPTAGAILLLAVGHSPASGTPNTPTPTKTGVTFTAERAHSYDTAGTAYKLSLFRGLVGVAAAGTIVIDFGGQSQTGAMWAIAEVTDVDTGGADGANAIAETAVSTVDAALATSGATAALAGVAASNVVYGVMHVQANETVTKEAAWTALGVSAGIASPDQAIMQAWKNAADDTTFGATWTSSVRWGGIIAELVDAPSAAGGQGNQTLMLGGVG
jgi:hypothetical protein